MATTPLVSIETQHNSNIHDAQLDYYGNKLATASSDRTIKIFEVVEENHHNQIESLSGHDGAVWQVAWAHPKYGVLLASCSYDRSVIIHRESPPGTWSPVHKHDLHTSSVNRSVSTFWCPQSFAISYLYEYGCLSSAAWPGTSVPQQLCCCCLLYTSPSPRDQRGSRMPSSA